MPTFQVFLNHYHITESWFHTAQVVYMIWNAINDPLFGYLQDNLKTSWMSSRRLNILYGAPFYSLTFLIPWFPWADYSKPENAWICGLHLMATLCFYDAVYTFVFLAQCALFTELSKKQEDRVRLVWYSQVAYLLGGNTVFFTESFSESLSDFTSFQVTCVVVAILGYFGIRYTGVHCHSKPESYRQDIEAESSKGNGEGILKQDATPLIRQMLQLISQRAFVGNVILFVCSCIFIRDHSEKPVLPRNKGGGEV